MAGLLAGAAWYGAHRAPVAARQAGGWTLVYDRPFGGKYEDFAFPDAKHGWLISSAGDIFHTADAGVTWTQQASGKGRLRSIDFLDEKRGFAGTLTGILYATTDGGVTWTDISKTLPIAPQGFCGMTHVGDHVHLVGRYNGGVADYFYSPDAGKTWRHTNLRLFAQGLVDVAFVSDTVGFIGGMSSTGPDGGGPAVILKTTDGGKNWRPVFTHDGGRGFAWKIFPVTSKLIYASLQSQDGIYRDAKSIDGGDTWEVQTIATGRNQGPAVQGVGFLDENTGWVGGFFQGMYATTDGGKSWTPVPMSDATFNRFEKIDGHTMFTAGTKGIVRYEAAIAQARSASCASIPASAKIAEIGAFSNMRFTTEHAYGATVMLWRAGACVFGLLENSAGLQGDTAIGELRDVKYDEKTGALSFSAKLTMGAVGVKDSTAFEPSRDLYTFEGRVQGGQLTGTLTHAFRNAIYASHAPDQEKVLLKTSRQDADSMHGPTLYSEWRAQWDPILKFRGPKW